MTNTLGGIYIHSICFLKQDVCTPERTPLCRCLRYLYCADIRDIRNSRLIRRFRRIEGGGWRAGLFFSVFKKFSRVFPKLRSRKLPNLRVTWHFSLVQRRVKNGQTLTVRGMVQKWQNFNSEVTNFSPRHPRSPWMYWNSIKLEGDVSCADLHI